MQTFCDHSEENSNLPAPEAKIQVPQDAEDTQFTLWSICAMIHDTVLRTQNGPSFMEQTSTKVCHKSLEYSRHSTLFQKYSYGARSSLSGSRRSPSAAPSRMRNSRRRRRKSWPVFWQNKAGITWRYVKIFEVLWLLYNLYIFLQEIRNIFGMHREYQRVRYQQFIHLIQIYPSTFYGLLRVTKAEQTLVPDSYGDWSYWVLLLLPLTA